MVLQYVDDLLLLGEKEEVVEEATVELFHFLAGGEVTEVQLMLKKVSSNSTLLSFSTAFYTLHLTCITPVCLSTLLRLSSKPQHSMLLCFQYCSPYV